MLALVNTKTKFSLPTLKYELLHHYAVTGGKKQNIFPHFHEWLLFSHDTASSHFWSTVSRCTALDSSSDIALKDPADPRALFPHPLIIITLLRELKRSGEEAEHRRPASVSEFPSHYSCSGRRAAVTGNERVKGCVVWPQITITMNYFQNVSFILVKK